MTDWRDYFLPWLFGFMLGVPIFAWGWSLDFPFNVPVCVVGAVMAAPLLVGAFSDA
jgi:hypothetical protein